MSAHELFDVVLNFNTGMDKRPKMSGSDKGEKCQQILEALTAKGMSQHTQGTLRLLRITKIIVQTANKWSSISVSGAGQSTGLFIPSKLP